jgi:serine/threonine protein kinase
MHICAECGKTTDHEQCGACGAQSLLQGRYRLLGLVGQGASGGTYRAEDCESGDTVAVKEMPWRLGDKPEQRRKLLRETEILQQIRHPMTPRYIRHFFTSRGRHSSLCIVQSFVEGRTLLEISADERLEQSEVWRVGEELLGILSHLHSLSPPVIHRDIKPANVIRREADGAYVLIDFGAVRDAATIDGLGTSSFTGTFGYMAPEVMQGYAQPGTDLYGLGALLVRLLTRKEPSELMDHRLAMDWKPHIGLPKGLETFLEKMIDPDPERRWHSAAIALSMLRKALHTPVEDREAMVAPQPDPGAWLGAMRQALREELAEAMESREGDSGQPQEKRTTGKKKAPDDMDPLSPGPLLEADDPSALAMLSPRHRKGWWEARPPSPPELRKPTHPATQLALMAALFFVITLALQVML